MLAELPEFLRKPITLEDARQTVRLQLDTREAGFLSLVRRVVYGYSQSPYRPLLEAARCELGDIERMVRADGLETTLLELRRSGVYVSFEEFKGREPIVRDGRAISSRPERFDNPLARTGFRISSGGSTGEGTPVWLSLPYLADRATSMLIGFAAHGVMGVPSASLREPLPAPSLSILLEDAHIGQVHERWFSPMVQGPPFSRWRCRAAHRLVDMVGRGAGVPVPHPEFVDVNRPLPMLRWVETKAKERGACMIRTSPSYALRACLGAEESGVSFEGVVFVGAGEPITPGKVEAMRRTGARWVTNYAVSEVGRPGIGCARTSDATDVHFMKHAVALVQYPRVVPGWGGQVDSFHFTSLLPTAPKVLLNVETDDFGIVEERSCGCPLEEAGFSEHLRDIYSYSKLTGEGVSLLGSDALRIIDVVLPERFGGSPADYQFVEEEDQRGLTRVTLVVSPRVQLPTDDQVTEAVLDGLGGSTAGASIRSIWRTAGTIQIRREEPQVTGRGKLMPMVARSKRPPEQ